MSDAAGSAGDPATGRIDGPGPAVVALGLAAALAAFTATFRGPRERFWDRMTLTGLVLGGASLALSRPTRRGLLGLRAWHVPAGLASAAALYATFAVGDRFARRFVPGGDREIRAIYALRELRPRPELAIRLGTVIGPAEELFWRGLVQAGLMRAVGRWPGAALAAGAYGGVHIVTGNLTLVGAAGVAGAEWCLLSAAGVPLGALIVSHVAWDIWIFLVAPTGETSAVAPA